jgi:hypothetical protein
LGAVKSTPLKPELRTVGMRPARSDDPITEAREPVDMCMCIGLLGMNQTGTPAYSTRFCWRWQDLKRPEASLGRTPPYSKILRFRKLSGTFFHVPRSIRKPITGIVSFDNSLNISRGAFLQGPSHRPPMSMQTKMGQLTCARLLCLGPTELGQPGIRSTKVEASKRR